MRTAGMTIVLATAFMATAILLIGCGSEEPTTTPSSGADGGEAITQTTCPVMGGPIDKSIFVEHEGRKVYFCCQMCVATFKKDPGKYLAKRDAQK